MLTHAPCLYCNQPLRLTLAGWLHPNGQNYAPDGHCGTPNRTKLTERESGRACFRAPTGRGGRRRVGPARSLSGRAARRR